jgi:high-affinity Fe2+/Pb2+ permease
MDEALAKKLSRQLKLLNFLLVFFVLIFMSFFAVAGLFAYGAMQEVRDAKNTLTNLQGKTEDTLNVRSELCDSSGTLSTLLKAQSNICN